jgi:hypothetical protein
LSFSWEAGNPLAALGILSSKKVDGVPHDIGLFTPPVWYNFRVNCQRTQCLVQIPCRCHHVTSLHDAGGRWPVPPPPPRGCHEKLFTLATESRGFVLVQELMLKPKIKQTTLHTLIITRTKFVAERKTGIYKVEK